MKLGQTSRARFVVGVVGNPGPVTRLLITHGDGSDTHPELELDFDIEVDLDGDAWSARPRPGSASPPEGYADGPVVVVVLDGDRDGARADAWASAQADGFALAGTAPFVQPEA